MRIIALILVLSGCSFLKSNTHRCFDLFEQYGKINMNVVERGRDIFSCSDKTPVVIREIE
jgi:hypothetical protein